MILVQNEFAFEDDGLLKYLICMVCHQIFKNPTRLHKCGHTFCQNCIHSPTCFSCNATILGKQQDLMANGLVSDLRVRCLTEDCPFRGSYEEFESSHRRKCQLRECGGLENWKRKIEASLHEMVAVKLSEKEQGTRREETIPHVSQLEGAGDVREGVAEEEGHMIVALSQQLDELDQSYEGYNNQWDNLD